MAAPLVFLKNIVGLWLLQESRRAWSAEGQDYDYAELNRLAAEAEPLRSLVAPNDPRFLAPNDMPAEIAAYCRDTGQPVPETAGQFTRCILESLALLYRDVLDTIEELTGRTIRLCTSSAEAAKVTCSTNVQRRDWTYRDCRTSGSHSCRQHIDSGHFHGRIGFP